MLLGVDSLSYIFSIFHLYSFASVSASEKTLLYIYGAPMHIAILPREVLHPTTILHSSEHLPRVNLMDGIS